MILSDEELLGFDKKRLAHWDPKRARRALAEQGDVYRAQLVAARWIDGWRERLQEDRSSPTADPDPRFDEGADYALREVVAHLRAGDLVPGGVLYEDEVSGPTLGRQRQ